MEVARAYLEASRDRDVDRMETLVSPTATVFELADEGSFERYAAGHLRPELGRMRTIAMTLGEPLEREASDHSLATVEWPVRRFTMERADGTVVDATGAATFLLAPSGDSWMIEHVHFSLRTAP
jgi:ketosteroid isomerase-like protein